MAHGQAQVSAFSRLGLVNQDGNEHRFDNEVDAELQKEADNK
jgi:hypothetical protein